MCGALLPSRQFHAHAVRSNNNASPNDDMAVPIMDVAKDLSDTVSGLCRLCNAGLHGFDS